MSADRRKCALCHSSLGDEAVMALNRLWHPDHFRCEACKNPIRQKFQAADNVPYCVECFSEKFNPRCAGCKETLLDSCLLAMDKHWHAKCFCCRLCKNPLPKGEYYVVDGNPYDLDCHWEMRLNARSKPIKDRHRCMVHYLGDSNALPSDDAGMRSHKVHAHRHKAKDVDNI